MAATWLYSLEILPKISPPNALCSHSHRGQDPVEGLLKKRLKTSCTALQLALTCARVKKAPLCQSGTVSFYLPIIHLLSLHRLQAPQSRDFILISTVGPDLGRMSCWNINDPVMLPFRKISVLQTWEPWGHFSPSPVQQ